MEYNFERIDIDILLKAFANTNCCVESSHLKWEIISATSTFAANNSIPEKLPSFKNMGCFNHYKNKN